MPITPKQQRIYTFICRYMESNKEAPTIAEIGRHFQMPSASVHAVLAVLKHEGLITVIPNISRGVRLVQPAATVQSEVSEMVM